MQVFLLKIYGSIFTHTEDTAADYEIGTVQLGRCIDIIGIVRGARDFRKIACDASCIGKETPHGIVILIAGPATWGGEGVNPSTLTTLAVAHGLGGWTVLPMAVLVFVLAYSSIIAAYVYSDVNMDYITGGNRWASWAVRVICALSATAGAVLSLDVVWNAVDIAMAVMTVTNLVALVRLFRWGTGALRDYEAQRRAGVAEPVFVGTDNPHLPADVPGDVWAPAPSATTTQEP